MSDGQERARESLNEEGWLRWLSMVSKTGVNNKRNECGGMKETEVFKRKMKKKELHASNLGFLN